MKSKLLFSSVLLATCILASCDLIKKEVDDPTTPTNPTDPTYYTLTISAGEGGTVNKEVNGKYEAGEQVKIIATANSGWQFSKWSDGDVRATRTLTMNRDYMLTASFEKKSTEPTETTYYIKHPWGTGADSSWEWRPMTKVGSNYEYEGLWGGVGANINTDPSDTGADWFPESAISGADALSIGDGVKFTYNPSNATLTATKTSDGGGNKNIAKVRIKCITVWDKIAWGLLDIDTDQIVLQVDFSGRTGTSDYENIDLSASHKYFLYYRDDTGIVYFGYQIGGGEGSEEFKEGHKYTYTVWGTDSGEQSRTDDGPF